VRVSFLVVLLAVTCPGSSVVWESLSRRSALPSHTNPPVVAKKSWLGYHLADVIVILRKIGRCDVSRWFNLALHPLPAPSYSHPPRSSPESKT
jgi:hypothetical protein